jgi:hypothetical protein
MINFGRISFFNQTREFQAVSQNQTVRASSNCQDLQKPNEELFNFPNINDEQLIEKSLFKMDVLFDDFDWESTVFFELFNKSFFRIFDLFWLNC